MKKYRRLTLFLLLLTLVAFIISFFDLTSYFTLESLKRNQAQIESFYQHSPLTIIGLYCLIYVLVTTFSIPGAAPILTLAGGAFFGVFMGTIFVSFASTCGATTAFLISRYLLRDWVQMKFKKQFQMVNRGIKNEGAFYLFSLRLIPVIPFFLINIVMGLTQIRIRTYFFVSQIGMLAGTIAYVNAGTQLAKIENLSGIVSPKILISFAILGLLPLVSKKFIEFLRHTWKPSTE